MVNVGHFSTEWSICLSVLFCSVKSLLFYLWRYLFKFLQEDFQGWARKTHFFPLIILWGSLDAEIMPRIWWRDCYQVLKGGLNLHLSNLSCSLLSTVGARGWKGADGTPFNQASNLIPSLNKRKGLFKICVWGISKMALVTVKNCPTPNIFQSTSSFFLVLKLLPFSEV